MTGQHRTQGVITTTQLQRPEADKRADRSMPCQPVSQYTPFTHRTQTQTYMWRRPLSVAYGGKAGGWNRLAAYIIHGGIGEGREARGS